MRRLSLGEVVNWITTQNRTIRHFGDSGDYRANDLAYRNLLLHGDRKCRERPSGRHAEKSVHSMLWVLALFLHVAGIFLLLRAEFLAAVQVIVYAVPS